MFELLELSNSHQIIARFMPSLHSLFGIYLRWIAAINCKFLIRD